MDGRSSLTAVVATPKNTVEDTMKRLSPRPVENFSHWMQQVAIKRETNMPANRSLTPESRRQRWSKVLTVHYGLQEGPENDRRGVTDPRHLEDESGGGERERKGTRAGNGTVLTTCVNLYSRRAAWQANLGKLLMYEWSCSTLQGCKVCHHSVCPCAPNYRNGQL